MTTTLIEILLDRFKKRDKEKPLLFWHRYYSSKLRKVVDGPYQDRKRFMRTFCEKAREKYFQLHPLRHAGASFMEKINIPTSDIQHILGHENRSTTERYIHNDPQKAYQAMNLYEEWRKKPVYSLTEYVGHAIF